jgi:LPS sulfotransferase NodH
MLCRALTDTGIAGRPDEYFLAVDERELPGWRCWEDGPFGRAHEARDREHYLEIVYDLGSTPNGIFGAKLMWNNAAWAVGKFQEMPRFDGLDRAAVFHGAFPGLDVVHVTRRDRVRQAVSWARMAQDGVWVVSDDEPARPTGALQYDFDPISGLEGLIAEGERGWRELFDELGMAPYEVVYEELVTEDGYRRAVLGVLKHLRLDTRGITAPLVLAHTGSRTSSTKRGSSATPPSAGRGLSTSNDVRAARIRCRIRTRLVVLADGGRCDGSCEFCPAEHIGAVRALTNRTNQGQVWERVGADLVTDGRDESVGEDYGVAAGPERPCSWVDVLGNAKLVVPRRHGFISDREVTLEFIGLAGAYDRGEDRRE